jgi:N-acetylglutamate synthase-like GNAT family acetyltransferase
MNAIIPIPRCEMSIRVATMSDCAFIDRLQKVHSKMVGFMRASEMEAKIKAGNILIAQDSTPLGYIVACDRYFKRDDVGIVYQVNIAPAKHRNLIGAMLVKAAFDRAAYGCKLFSCWCAQDLEANLFWESLGFIPLAVRAGSRGKNRVHVFWQKRIREGDVTTPYWFPSKTDSGAIREDRLVMPIPPGVHWKDAQPFILPSENLKLKGPTQTAKNKPQITSRSAIIRLSGVSFSAPVAEKPKRQKPRREKIKADPKHVAAARELRDRYLEQFNSGLVLPNAKYDVARALPSEDRKLLAA